MEKHEKVALTIGIILIVTGFILLALPGAAW